MDKKKEAIIIPSSASSFEDKTSPKELNKIRKLHKKYDADNNAIPPLSQREREHLTFLMVTQKYNELKNKRLSARRYGSLFIIISGIVFLTLMFSLESKIQCLCLWIATILYCVSVMLKSDYNYQVFKEILGAEDENDYYDLEEDEPDDPVPITDSVNDPIILEK